MESLGSVHNKKVVVLVPAYEPSEELLRLVAALRRREYTVVIVNDGSRSEASLQILHGFSTEDCFVISHAVNLGKGRAIKTGINYIIDHFPNADAMVTVDADGQHTPDAVDDCVNAYYQSGKNKMILGVRRFDKRTVPLRSRFGNKVTRIAMKFLCGVDVSDTQTGLRVIPFRYLEECLKIPGEKYEYETNVLLKAKEVGIAFEEVPIKTIYIEDNRFSHFNPVRDSFLIYKIIVLYAMSAGISTVIDYIVFSVAIGFQTEIWLATTWGRLCSASVNFLVNKKMVFCNKGNLSRQVLSYLVLLVFSGTVSALVVTLLAEKNGWNPICSKLLVDTGLWFFNFYIQRKFIFSKKKISIQ